MLPSQVLQTLVVKGLVGFSPVAVLTKGHTTACCHKKNVTEKDSNSSALCAKKY